MSGRLELISACSWKQPWQTRRDSWLDTQTNQTLNTFPLMFRSLVPSVHLLWTACVWTAKGNKLSTGATKENHCRLQRLQRESMRRPESTGFNSDFQTRTRSNVPVRYCIPIWSRLWGFGEFKQENGLNAFCFSLFSHRALYKRPSDDTIAKKNKQTKLNKIKLHNMWKMVCKLHKSTEQPPQKGLEKM